VERGLENVFGECTCGVAWRMFLESGPESNLESGPEFGSESG
jgi:hypothetical protein